MDYEEPQFELEFPSGETLLLSGMANYGVASHCAALGQALASACASPRCPSPSPAVAAAGCAATTTATPATAAAAIRAACATGGPQQQQQQQQQSELRVTSHADVLPTAPVSHDDCTETAGAATATATTTTASATATATATAAHATTTTTIDDWTEVLLAAADAFEHMGSGGGGEYTSSPTAAAAAAAVAASITPSGSETAVRVTAVLHAPLRGGGCSVSAGPVAGAGYPCSLSGGGNSAAAASTATAAVASDGIETAADDADAAAGVYRLPAASRRNSHLLQLLGLPQEGSSLRAPYEAAAFEGAAAAAGGGTTGSSSAASAAPLPLPSARLEVVDLAAYCWGAVGGSNGASSASLQTAAPHTGVGGGACTAGPRGSSSPCPLPPLLSGCGAYHPRPAAAAAAAAAAARSQPSPRAIPSDVSLSLPPPPAATMAAGRQRAAAVGAATAAADSALVAAAAAAAAPPLLPLQCQRECPVEVEVVRLGARADGTAYRLPYGFEWLTFDIDDPKFRSGGANGGADGGDEPWVLNDPWVADSWAWGLDDGDGAADVDVYGAVLDKALHGGLEYDLQYGVGCSDDGGRGGLWRR